MESDVRTAVQAKTPPPDMPAGAVEPAPITRRRIYTTQPSTEEAARMSANNPRGLLNFRDELAGWIADMDRYSGSKGGDRAFWLQATGGRAWTPDRVKDDVKVSVPHLTWAVLGGIQPDRLASALLAGDDDGLAARFLYAWPATKPAIRTPCLGDQLNIAVPWFTALRKLPWTPPEPILLPLTPDAISALNAWRHDCAAKEAEGAGLFLGWIGKLPGLSLRLALILEHLEWCVTPDAAPPVCISTRAFLRAVAFLDCYAVPMARRCFGEAALPQAERDARLLLKWLRRQNPTPQTINARELRRIENGPSIRDATQMDAALRELAGLGIVRPADPERAGKGGRSRKDWDVHPSLLTNGR